MTRLLLGLSEGLACLDVDGDSATARRTLDAGRLSSIFADPLTPGRVYAVGRGAGFWRSVDGGDSWERAGAGIDRDQLTRVSVSRSDRPGGIGAVFVGTELTALFRSEDSGDSFTELKGLQDIPSRPEWSFPPRPSTHHFQSFASDVEDPNLMFVGIEVGGVMRSTDGGRTWEDHNPDVDGDPHMLLTHPAQPGRVYVGGGASYCETLDGGETWTREYDEFPDEVRYFYDAAVDPGDPERVLLVSARDHITGHGLLPNLDCWSTVYGRSAGGHWEEAADGLPAAEGSEMGWLASDGVTPGLFFYSTVDGDVFRSDDAGGHWHAVSVDWPTPPGRRGVIAMTAIPD